MMIVKVMIDLDKFSEIHDDEIKNELEVILKGTVSDLFRVKYVMATIVEGER